MRRKASMVRLKADTTGNFSTGMRIAMAHAWPLPPAIASRCAENDGSWRRRRRSAPSRCSASPAWTIDPRAAAAVCFLRSTALSQPAAVHESAQQRGAGGCVTCRHICPKFARSASCGRRSAPRSTSFRFNSSRRSPSFAGMHLDFFWPTKSGSARPFKPA